MDLMDKFEWFGSVLAGLFFFLRRSKLVDGALRDWNKKLPEARNFRLGYLIGFSVIGMAFIILGILGLFGLIKLRH